MAQHVTRLPGGSVTIVYPAAFNGRSVDMRITMNVHTCKVTGDMPSKQAFFSTFVLPLYRSHGHLPKQYEGIRDDAIANWEERDLTEVLEEFLKNICTGLFPMDMEVFIADLELMLGKKEYAEID